MAGKGFRGGGIGVRPVPSKACFTGKPTDILSAVDPKTGSHLGAQAPPGPTELLGGC